MKQILDANNPFHNIDEAYCRAQNESVGSYNYNYARGLLTVYLSSTVNPEGGVCVSAVHTVDGMMLLKVGYFLVMSDGHNIRRLVKMLQDENVVE